MKKSKAILLKYVPAVDGNGNVSKKLEQAGEVRGIFIPFSSEMASKRSGYDENQSWQFFYQGSHPDLLTGNVIRYLGQDYHIVNISDLGRVKILKLNRVIGTRNVRNVVQVLNY